MGFSADVNLCALTHAGPIQAEACEVVESCNVFAQTIYARSRMRAQSRLNRARYLRSRSESFTELRLVRVAANNLRPASASELERRHTAITACNCKRSKRS